MKGWTKISTYEGFHLASLHKNLLESYDIKTVLLEKKDTVFLLGEYDIYVEESFAAKATALIDEFSGLIKIVGLNTLKPVSVLKNILDKNEIDSILLTRAEGAQLLYDYELYIYKEQQDQANEVLQKMDGWAVAGLFEKEDQTLFMVEILANKNIDSIILKKKDSDYHITEVQLWVEQQNLETAKNALNELSGWKKMKTLHKYHQVELHEDLFKRKERDLLVIKQKDFASLDSAFDLYVRENEFDELNSLAHQVSDWVKIAVYPEEYLAQLSSGILSDNGIDNVVVTKKDSAFLLGAVELFVERENMEKAEEILTSAKIEDEEMNVTE